MSNKRKNEFGYGYIYVPCTINELITKRISDYTDIDFDDPDIIHRYIVDTPSDEFVKKYKAKDKHICVVQDRSKLRFYSPTEYMCSLIIDDDKICQYKNNNWVPIYTFLVSQGSGGGGGGGGGSTGISDAPNNGKLYARKNRGWVQVPEQSITSDAPTDGSTYGRNNGNWVKVNEFIDVTDPTKKYLRKKDGWVEYQEPTIPAPIITNDVPNDNKNYVRKNKNWAPLDIPDQVITSDVANDNKQYIRKNKAWAEVVFPQQAISTDANFDGKKYLRSNGTWVEYTLPTQAISTDAPSDTKLYGRKDGNWEEVTIATGGIDDVADNKNYLRTQNSWVEYIDAPSDNKTYGRKDGAWTELVSGTPGISDVPDNKKYLRSQNNWIEYTEPTQAISTDAPSDTKVYGRKDGNWEEIVSGNGGIAEAPNDGSIYGRTNGNWANLDYQYLKDVPDNKKYVKSAGSWIELPVDEAPEDSKQYVRKNKTWVELTLPISDDAPSDGFDYVRNNAVWKKLVIPTSPTGGITDVPDNKKYLRSQGAWAEYTEPAIMDDATSDSKVYGRKNGAWAEIQASTIGDPPTDEYVYGRKGNQWVTFSADLIPGADTEELFGFGRDGSLITLDQHFESFVSKIDNHSHPGYTKEKEYILKENKWEEITGYNKYIDLNCYINTNSGFDSQQSPSTETSPYKTLDHTLEYIKNECKKYPKAHFNIKITITGTEDFGSNQDASHYRNFHFDKYNINSLSIISATPDNLFRIALHGLSGIEKWFISGNIKNLFFKNYKFSILNNSELDKLCFFKLNDCNIKLENCSFEQDSDKVIDLLKGNNCNFEFDDKFIIKNIKTAIKGNHNSIDVKEIEADNVTTLIDGNNNTIKTIFDKSKFTNIISANSQNNVILNKLTNDNKIYGIKNQVSEEITLSNEEEIDYNLGYYTTKSIQTDWDSGNDDTGDGTPGNPFKTIEKAVNYLNTLEDSANSGYNLDFGMSDSYVMTEDVRIKIKNAQIYFNTSPGARNIKVKTNKRIIFEGNRNHLEFGGIEFTSDDTNIKSFVDFNNIKGKLYIKNLNFNNNISSTSTGNGYVNIINCANVELSTFEGDNTKSSIFNIFASNCYIHDMVYKNYNNNKPYGIYDNSVVNISNETYENSTVYGEINNSISTKNISKPLEIINSVVSDSETSALSAKQGKFLNDKIDALTNGSTPDNTEENIIIYIDNDNGNDNNDGTTYENSVKTIKKAIELVNKNNPNKHYELRLRQGQSYPYDSLIEIDGKKCSIYFAGRPGRINFIKTNKDARFIIKNNTGTIKLEGIEFNCTASDNNTHLLEIYDNSGLIDLSNNTFKSAVNTLNSSNHENAFIIIRNSNFISNSTTLENLSGVNGLLIENSKGYMANNIFRNFSGSYYPYITLNSTINITQEYNESTSKPNYYNSVIFKDTNLLEIENTLTSESEDKVLSAKQGKVLNEKIDALASGGAPVNRPTYINYQDIFIAENGNDETNNGTESSSPFKTIKKAFEYIETQKDRCNNYNAGFKINIGQGTFDVGNDLMYGNKKANIYFQGEYSGNEIKSILKPISQNASLDFFECAGNVTFSSIKFSCDGVSNEYRSGVLGFFNVHGTVEVDYCEFDKIEARESFIKIYNCNSFIIDNCNFHDFSNQPIEIKYSIGDMKNCKFKDLQMSEPPVRLYNSILRYQNNIFDNIGSSIYYQENNSVLVDTGPVVDHHYIWISNDPADNGEDNRNDPYRGFINNKPFKTLEYAMKQIDKNESGKLHIFIKSKADTPHTITKPIIFKKSDYSYDSISFNENNIIGEILVDSVEFSKLDDTIRFHAALHFDGSWNVAINALRIKFSPTTTITKTEDTYFYGIACTNTNTVSMWTPSIKASETLADNRKIYGLYLSFTKFLIYFPYMDNLSQCIETNYSFGNIDRGFGSDNKKIISNSASYLICNNIGLDIVSGGTKLTTSSNGITIGYNN